MLHANISILLDFFLNAVFCKFIVLISYNVPNFYTDLVIRNPYKAFIYSASVKSYQYLTFAILENI